MVNFPKRKLSYLTRIRKLNVNQLVENIILFDQRIPKLSNPFKINRFLFDWDSEKQKSI